MMDLLPQLVAWLNMAANRLGSFLLAPIAVLPGWVSATLIAIVTGVLMLVIFKYTSNQRAIKRVRDDISANMLALKLYKESMLVALRAQWRLLRGAVGLLVLALVPMAVMVLPITLLLGQLSLWYQARPLAVDENAVMTLRLNGGTDASWPDVQLQPTEAFEVVTGPVRVQSQREICWELRARAAGSHRAVFLVDGQAVDKELVVGDGYMRVSSQRPGWSCLDALENPGEKPFGPESPVRSIEIDYPPRLTWNLLGFRIYPWMLYWFGMSMVAGFCFAKLFNVNL
jgi:hypothetical protein